MILSRAVLLATAIVASYVLLNIVASAVVAVLWRAGRLRWPDRPAAMRAGRLSTLRLLPACASALLTLPVVFAFLAFEPAHEFEEVGPVLLTVALIGAMLATRSAVVAVRTVVTTRRVRRLFMTGATPLRLEAVTDLDAYTIESVPSIVALVGVWRPVCVVARIVVDACSESELTQIIRHERRHLSARDNLKRFLMTCVPDALTLTPYHRAIRSAWYDAAEDAADDAATRDEPLARVELAGLLLKVAALAPSTGYARATVSPLIGADRLERRVRRLVSDAPPTHVTGSDRLAGAFLVALALLASTPLFSSTACSIVHSAVEAVVAAGAPGR